MDAYLEVARKYFESLEGAQHYPKLRTYHWYGLLLAVVAAGLDFWWVVVRNAHMTLASAALTFVCVGLVVVMTVIIDDHKKKSLLSVARSRGETPKTLDDVRRAELTRLCGVGPDGFAPIAKDCAELMALQKTHRLSSEMGARYYWRQVFDPESKARVLAISFAALAMLVTLTSRSWPTDYPSPLEVVASDGLLQTLGLLLFCVVMLFGMWIALQVTLRTAMHATQLWGAKFMRGPQAGSVSTRYFLSDLIRLHTPRLPVALKEDVSSATPSIEDRAHVADKPAGSAT